METSGLWYMLHKAVSQSFIAIAEAQCSSEDYYGQQSSAVNKEFTW